MNVSIKVIRPALPNQVSQTDCLLYTETGSLNWMKVKVRCKSIVC